MKCRWKIVFICLCILCLASCSKKDIRSYATDQINLFNLNNGNSNADTLSVDSVKSKAYAIRIVLHEKILNPIENRQYQESVYYDRKYSLTGFKVRTVTDFDSTHLAGSEVSEYFLYSYCTACTLDNFISKKVLNKRESFLGYKEEFTSDEKIMLMKPPAARGTYAFEVNMAFEDGTSLTKIVQVKLLD